VGVSLSATRSKVSVGSNPWLPRGRANIAQICERYGGGGHPVVGAVSLKPAELPRAREIAGEIADELRRFVAASLGGQGG
jgi:nanoRNase/pAp phosphatase (c-di-AMP/oligoRNAs hydrolase)